MNSNPEHRDDSLDAHIRELERSLAFAEDRLDNEIDKWNQHMRGPRKGIESAEQDIVAATEALAKAREKQQRLLEEASQRDAASITDSVRDAIAEQHGQLSLFPEFERTKKR